MNTKRFILLCCISLALSNTTTPTWAQAPSTAKIAFTSTRDGNAEIYIMNPDGSQQKNLTHHNARDGAPVWSPTGKHIAFHSDRHGLRDLYIMDANGKNVRKLFKDLVYREFPTWSPDGKKIAYYRWDGGDGTIYMANIDGSAEEHLAETGPLGGFPAWSPDGSQIIFTYRFKEAIGFTRLDSVNVNTHEVTTHYDPNEPASLTDAVWSPDSNIIAFSWLKKGIFLLNTNTKVAKKVIAGTQPAWSPRGDILLYTKGSHIHAFHFSSRRSNQLTAGAGTVNVQPNWFDPAVLPVTPQSYLITTRWAALKKQ